MRRTIAGLAALAVVGGVLPTAAEVLPRTAPAAGSVIARKSGEEVRFIDVSSWRVVEVEQDLLPGDVLRTNAQGQLAVLFSDRTQMRLGRNTTLLVKKVGAAEDAQFSLQGGTIWARAERGGAGLTVETPAASAAIRGTDWTMTVDGDKSSLIVLEGLVEFSNELGSVPVAQGEAAVATIGQAPSKVLIVDPDDREQMLFYMSIRTVFGEMPASPLPTADMRRERARIQALADAERSAEDWLTLAETAMTYDGVAQAAAAADRARSMRLSKAEKARLDLIDALAVGEAQRFAEAARLFERAASRLDGRRRAMALYGGYFARSLADPSRVETPPVIRDGGPYAAIAEAWTAGFLKDLHMAAEIIRRAEKEYPDEAALPAFRAQIAMLLDDREQVKEAVERALALQPDDPFALQARASYRAGIESDMNGARADLLQAIEAAPGATSLWNGLGLVESARGADREAEAALRRAIELAPNDPVARANLAILLLDEDRVSEAKAEIDKALALDAGFDIGLVARGRYHLQTGEMDKALQDLLAGSTANPAYAQALLMLAAGYYENGQREPAEQALANADRLDPNDPVTAMFETAIAVDDYDSDRAIKSAQEAVKRSRARGGDYAPLSASRDAGSLLNSAFRLQGLDAWGRFYGDVVFDPFSGAALVDQALSGSPNPFQANLDFGADSVDAQSNTSGFSGFFQGLMQSPEMLAGRSRSANLLRRPFLEGAVSGGFTNTGKDWGWTTGLEVQAFSADPKPWSLYGQVTGLDSEEFRERIDPGTAVPYVGFNLGFEDVDGMAYLTARPTAADRVVAYIDVQNDKDSFTDGVVVLDPTQSIFNAMTYDREVTLESLLGGIGWSHTLGYENVVNAAFFANDLTQSSDELGTLFVQSFPLGQRRLEATTDQQSYQGALNHSIGLGDATFRYGVEGGTLTQVRTETDTQVILGEVTTAVASRDVDVQYGQAYADAVYEFTPDLKAEAGLFWNVIGGSLELDRLAPRLGVAWTPANGHWLRAGYLREVTTISTTTLAPIGVVGLQANQTPLDIGGYADTFAARWEAEWTPRLFTAVDFQHQELYTLSIPVPGSIIPIDAADGVGDGEVDRLSATANLYLGAGFGAFATVVRTDSRNTTAGSPTYGEALPFVPELSGRGGFTYVHPSNLKMTLSTTYIGERVGDAVGTELDPYWTLDAALLWEPFDKRFALELGAYNLLDEDFDVATSMPGWGRSFTGTLKVRF